MKKIDALLDELETHPYTGTGRPEPMKYGYWGYWSRRITQKHRLVYSIVDKPPKVVIHQAFGHYDD